ncbi:MAG: TerB family tellurite resistance protein [Deltaproteobacteria bacterium]|nr:TerB family tellurite resistance protein [Candidatus Anaeroferrophillus wilburensis]MBN2887774.1 TerB family tellurite resistance protein [Deltaproteobacteria bacterium]
MITTFKKLLLFQAEAQGGNEKKGDELQLAIAMLLVEIALADDVLHAREEQLILRVLQKLFSLSPQDAGDLLSRSRQKHAESIDLYPATRTINDHFSPAEKSRLLETVWQLVFADGILDQHEDYLMHKLAKLLRLSHRQLIEAKLKARKLQEQGRAGGIKC